MVPGPGAYSPKPIFKDVKSGQRWGRDKRGDLADPNGAFIPAPNAYSLSSSRYTTKTAPAFGFGTSKRP